MRYMLVGKKPKKMKFKKTIAAESKLFINYFTGTGAAWDLIFVASFTSQKINNMKIRFDNALNLVA